MALSTAELDFMIAESPDAVAVEFGDETTTGVLDTDVAEIDESGLRVIGDAIVLTIRDGTLTSLNQDDTITVATVDYKIRDIGKKLTDGTRRLQLVEV